MRVSAAVIFLGLLMSGNVELNPGPKQGEVVKSGQIKDPDRMFNNLSKHICERYTEVGIQLGLKGEVLTDELETGELKMLQGSRKALKMLHLWKQSVTEDDFTYYGLAAALEKEGFSNSAHKYCYSRIDLEDKKHDDAYKSALNDGFVLNMRYLKFLFFGPPRTGKSTARRRLVQEIVNLSLDGPSASTKLVEQTDAMVCIKKSSSETATICGSKWSSMKRSKEGERLNEHSEEDISYLIQLLHKLISKNARKPQKTNTVQDAVSNDAMEQKTTGPPKLSNSAEKPGELLSDAEEMEIDEALTKFTTIINSESPKDLHKFLEDLMMLNMVDVGGQPAFLELCPAFTAGPALYFIFFRLDLDLKAKNEVKFQSADGKETILNSSYCTQTVILQALSSIACFGSHARAEADESLPFSNVSGRALLFGTYKDEVDDKRISQMNTTLREQFENTELCKQNLLLKASDTRFFYSLNNQTGDESEMTPIREDIEKITINFFPSLPIPGSWLMFRVILHLLKKPIVTLAVCRKIAKHVSMTTPIREAIWFFHHNIGSLMHYPDIPSMKDIVICDTQVVFDTTSELIIDTFKTENRDSNIPQGAIDNFHKNGQFSLAHIKDRTESHQNNRLSLEQLIDLLKHHNIIAEICPDQKKSEQLESNQEISTADQESLAQAKPNPKISAQTTNPTFIMPAVLQDASEEDLDLVSSSMSTQEVPPLIIYFVTGFVPFGVFCASIANLIAHQDSMSPRWKLCDKQMKNKVTFCIGNSYATLISRPQYLEILVKQHPNARKKYSLEDICSTVQQRVVQTLETVISKMRKSSHAKMETPMFPSDDMFVPAFPCCLNKSHSNHFMKVDRDESEYFGKCLKEHMEIDITKEQLMWFSQTEQDIGDKSQPTESNSSAAKRKNECADQPDEHARKIKKVVKSGQITYPDRLFSDLSKHIGKKYLEIGTKLNLPYDELVNVLDTGEFKMREASQKAMKMLQLWKASATEENFTYSVLAAALEDNGLQRCAEQYCYTTAI